MNCPHCGAHNEDRALECARCFRPLVDQGATIGGSSSSQSFGAVPPAQAPEAPKTPAPPSPPPSSSAQVAPPSGSGAHSAPSHFSLSSALAPGTQFGPRYRIESLLGEGGMGAVYKAYDKELDRIIAIKLLQPGLTRDPEALQRFKQELLLASRISHKNILRIHDLGEVEGVKFITMAFIEGQDLHTILKRGKLNLERAVSLARQIAQALDAAHAEGVVHRDLKPQNILVDAGDTIYVSDFGLAKSLDTGAEQMTRAGQVLGTPRYMSPEQVEGKPADHRADLYALGLILYEMCTGCFPFEGDSTLSMMYARAKQKPKNPVLVNPEVPGWLARIILHCLEREPYKRYQSAHEIVADLDAGGTGAGAGARSGFGSGARSVQISLALPETRRGWLLAGGGVLAALLLLVITIAPLRHLVLRRSAAPEEAPRVLTGIPPLAQGRYIAVLPPRTLGTDQALAYLAEGVSEALAAKLFQLKSVHIAGPASAEVLRQRDSLERVARSLGANLVVDGVLQSSGEQIRIILHLQDVAAGRRLWSQQFSGLAADLLTLEDQIASALFAALEIRPDAEELARSAARPTDSMEAYDLYLRGRNAMRGEQDAQKLESALRLFEQAGAKDPRFPLAFAGLADASLALYRLKKEQIWVQKALAAAQRARDLNDNLPEVHSALGRVYSATGKSAEALAELRRALALAPNSDDAHRRLANAYRNAGNKEEALKGYRRAIEINPYFWVNYNALGGALLTFGENDEAAAAFRKVTELEPDNPVGHENLASVYLRQGKWEQCIAGYQKALALQPFYSTYSNLGTAYFFLKRYAEAVQMYEKAVELNPHDQTSAGNLADALRWSGQKERAAAAYDRAIALAYKELEVNPRDAGALGMLALYYGKKGDARNALDFIRRARTMDRNDVQLMYNQALIHALLGHKPDSLRALREAFQKGYPAREAANDPEFSALAADPEFKRLVEQFSAPKQTP
jgi:tetratricopeptide (TPR) repeat protein